MSQVYKPVAEASFAAPPVDFFLLFILQDPRLKVSVKFTCFRFSQTISMYRFVQ